MTKKKCRKIICSYEFLSEIVKECHEGYVLYRVVKDCDPKDALYLVYFLLEFKRVNANATYRRRPILRWVLDMVDMADANIKMIAIARDLVLHGADPNIRDSKGNTLLHYIVRHCLVFEEYVEILLDRGADPNIRNKQGETPLHTLFKYGYCGNERKARIAKILIERGANPHIRDKNGKTPLEYTTSEVLQQTLQKPTP